MSKLEIDGCWHIIRGKLQQLWAKLTDDDFHDLRGRQDERLGRMQKRAGKHRMAVEKEVEEAIYACYCI